MSYVYVTKIRGNALLIGMDSSAAATRTLFIGMDRGITALALPQMMGFS